MAATLDTTKTERAPNLTPSQVVIELAIRLSEKESLTLFLWDGISLPSPQSQSYKKLFGLGNSYEQFILQR